MAKILYVTNDAWFFVSHRLPIAIEFQRSRGECVVASKWDSTVDRITEQDCQFVGWRVSPRGKSVWGEIKSFISLARIFYRQKPDIVHLVTIKPVLYGGILSRLLRVPCCVYAISGLGSIFRSSTTHVRLLRSIIMPFYKFAISHSNGMVIFQNPDDRNMMLSRLGLKNLKTILIKGSGVDTENYPLVPEPDDPILVTMAARLLRDKGVSEFVAAAKQLSDEGCNAKFQIAGGNVAEGNPGAYSKAELDTLKGSNIVDFLGHQEDMPTVLSKSNIVVLPSYHEGLPKVLVEAGAAGRPIVTTDVPGCRDAVIHLQTGILVPVKDARALAEAIKTLVDDKQMRIDMGNAGRNFVENELSIDIVIDQHMAVYDELLASKTGSIVDRQ